MPPKGYKKGYVRHPETNEWVDPRVLANEQEEKLKVMAPLEPVRKKVTVVKPLKKRKAKDELGPETKSIKANTDHSKVIISWIDKRGRARTTQYVMADLTINENVHETFENGRKKTHINLSLDGTVLEKL